MAKISVRCGYCKTSFLVLKSQILRGRGKFCSRKCSDSAQIKKDDSLLMEEGECQQEANMDEICQTESWSELESSNSAKLRLELLPRICLFDCPWGTKEIEENFDGSYKLRAPDPNSGF